MKANVLTLFAIISLVSFKTFSQVSFQEQVFTTSKEPTSSTSFVDVNNDGFLDIFTTTGEQGYTNHLFLNNKNGTYSESKNNDFKKDNVNSFSSSWADYDNDGDLDVYIANADYQNEKGEYCLFYKNDGLGNFTKESNILTTDFLNGAYGSSWADYNKDGNVDLYVSCSYGPSILYKNSGNGDFQRIDNLPGVTASGYSSISASWIDFDNDGYMDIYSPARYVNSVLLKNQQNGTFINAGTKLTNPNPYGWSGSLRGASWFDYDKDGNMDVIIPDANNNYLYLMRNTADGNFELTNFLYYTSWSATTIDINNDGWEDIVTINGGLNVFLNNYGSFNSNPDYSLYAEFGQNSPFNITAGDYDNDGKVDLLVGCRFNNLGGYGVNKLFRNTSPNCNNWLQVKTTQLKNNKYAIGAKVYCYYKEYGKTVRNYKQVTSTHAGNYTSSGGDILNFGVGTQQLVDSVVVIWSVGTKTKIENVTANQRIEIFDNDSVTILKSNVFDNKPTIKITPHYIEVGCKKIVTYLSYNIPVDWYDAKTGNFIASQTKLLLEPDSNLTYMIRTLCEYSAPFDILKFQNQSCPTQAPCELDKIFIPNIITPNNDQKNETFEIGLNGVKSKIDLNIINRWGDSVFSSKDYKDNWGGEDLSDGIYYYHLKFTDLQKCEAKGWVEIAR